VAGVLRRVVCEPILFSTRETGGGLHRLGGERIGWCSGQDIGPQDAMVVILKCRSRGRTFMHQEVVVALGPAISRSWLFVPASEDRKVERALKSGADAVILDLEDGVAPSAKEAARRQVQAVLARGARPWLYARVNRLQSGLLLRGLEVVVPAWAQGDCASQD
jgi:hypothetical protein